MRPSSFSTRKPTTSQDITNGRRFRSKEQSLSQTLVWKRKETNSRDSRTRHGECSRQSSRRRPLFFLSIVFPLITCYPRGTLIELEPKPGLSPESWFVQESLGPRCGASPPSPASEAGYPKTRVSELCPRSIYLSFLLVVKDLPVVCSTS